MTKKMANLSTNSQTPNKKAKVIDDHAPLSTATTKNFEVLEALAAAQNLAMVIREVLPVKGLKTVYSAESSEIRHDAENEAAWYSLELARLTSPGAFTINAAVSLPWNMLGRVIAEIQEYWGWAHQDVKGQHSSSRARDRGKLKSLPLGMLQRLESACRLLDFKVKLLPDDSKDPEKERTRKAYHLWQAGKHTWREIAKEIEGDEQFEAAIKSRVKKYAKDKKLNLRSGKAGRVSKKK